MKDPTTALALENATIGYPGRIVLESASVAIPAGRRVALVGRNGSGKSTLLKTLAGIQRPISGRVTCSGAGLGSMSPSARGRRIAYLPQQVSPDIPFTVFEVVLMGRYPHSGMGLFSTAADRMIVTEVIEAAGLGPLSGKRCTELSGGEFQRVLVASILAQKATVMLLDEPTASLDLKYRSAILAMLGGDASGDRTVVIATHDLDLAMARSDWAIALDGEGGVQAGPTGEVLTEEFVSRSFGVDARLVEVDLPDGKRSRHFVVVG